MASRKKTPNEAEIVPDEVIVDAKPVNKGPARKVVETKTITYEQPVDEIEETEPEPDYDYDEAPKQRKKKTEKELRNALRERLGKSGVLPTSQLRIHVFKFENENDPTSGVTAEKSFCCKFFCNEDGVTNGQHLDIAQKYGPGRYLFMVYMNNAIVTSFEERVSAPSFGQVVQNGQPVTMPDPQNPGQVIVQMPANQVQADPFADFDKTLKMFERMEKMRQSLGLAPQSTEQPKPELSPEMQLASVLLTDSDMKKKAIKNLFNGDAGEKDILTTIIENAEPIGQAVQGIIGSIFANLQNIRGSNGQAQMAQTATQNHQSQIPGNEPDNRREDLSGDHPQGIALTEAYQDVSQNGQPQMPGQAIRPEDELLAGILDHCKRKQSPRLAADRAMKYAEWIESVAPQQSIFVIIEQFTDNPIEDSLLFLETINDEAKEIIAMPHAKQWATQLQAELKKAYEPGGENGA